MRVLVVCALLLSPHAARAEASSELAARLVGFAHSSCDYLHGHLFDPPAPVWPAHKLAAHFGRVQRSARIGATTEFYIAVPEFPGWKVTYSDRIIKLELPSDVMLTMADLVPLLGTPKPPDVDHARTDNGEHPRPRREQWAFPPSADRNICRIRATTDAKGDDVGQQRVLTFSFQD
jgi:hypothetical protein